ncbi:DUF4062 domain-containing protein [Aliarcobacter butzleri]|uniref:DUF4062 domain-containing protein n=1 Tax=Aliarcobacter butzleri TaxID=28197 RepID=UPI0024DE03BD|nr:DUF4062 domain-containing protein [Aliarcobacter butzleri]MDK2051706.1 DUF4062 domain-containing protein [Aliarcobacter butzleri]
MTEKKYQIFISSTFKDLETERDSIIKAILEMYHIPIGMEMFSAEDEDQWEIIRRTIDISDYYILILGLRYGSETSEGISFTQKEYEYALERKIPILAFLLDEKAPLSQDKRDNDLTKINLFRSTVLKNSKMSGFWKNTDELTKGVSISLMKQIMQKPGIGWIRGDQAISTELSEELTHLSKENRELRDSIKELESKISSKYPKIKLEIEDLTVDGKFNSFKRLTLPEKIDINNIEEYLKNYIIEDEINQYNNNIPSQIEIDEYNNQWEKYYKIKNYSLGLIIKISNTGTVKANNLYITIKFPDNVLIVDNDQKLEIPQSPIVYSPIESAQTRYKKTLKTSNTKNSLISVLSSPEYKLPKIRPFNQNWWTKLDNNKLTIKIDSLLHTRSMEFDDEYLIIPLKIGKYNIEVSVICEEFEYEDKQIVELEVKEI